MAERLECSLTVDYGGRYRTIYSSQKLKLSILKMEGFHLNYPSIRLRCLESMKCLPAPAQISPSGSPLLTQTSPHKEAAHSVPGPPPRSHTPQRARLACSTEERHPRATTHPRPCTASNRVGSVGGLRGGVGDRKSSRQ